MKNAKLKAALQTLKEAILNSDDDIDKNGLWDAYLSLIRVIEKEVK